MFKLKRKHAISELSEQSLQLVSGGTGGAVVVETPAEVEDDITILLMPVGGTKVPPPQP
jgi:hypothetical protein